MDSCSEAYSRFFSGDKDALTNTHGQARGVAVAIP